MTPEYYTSTGLEPYRHGFFTRKGGVSIGTFHSLNCGVCGDDLRENGLQNRSIIAQKLGHADKSIMFLKQIHSSKVHVVRKPPQNRIEADGVVTDTAGIGIGILTADCQPIILSDPESNVVGAVHAGWRGTLDGVIQNVITVMSSLGARRENVRGAIGPSISQKNYEFGGDLRQKFVKRYPYSEPHFQQTTGDRYLFNLVALTKDIFADEGIDQVEVIGLCTYDHEELFFSCRRSAHRNERSFGLNGSVIFT